ncbi:MAG: cytochrome c biogenesis protein ResB [Verrucomicrobia bacterium]|nr:cytochrome c biogenesis protein ResB [Verrucomicrobiota bacterium]
MRAKLLAVLCSLKLTLVLLVSGLVVVFIGTVAQADEGLYYAQARYFKSWVVSGFSFFGHKVPLPLPGGYLIGTLLLANLTAAHIQRLKVSWKKSGILLTHAGLILLLLGQLGTDMLSIESAMRLEEGETKNYSEDFQSNELVFIDTSDPKDDSVVSVPESFLARGGTIADKRMPLEVRVKHYWPNCDLEERPPAGSVPAAATHGMFTNRVVHALKPDDTDSRARAAAVVEFTSSKGSHGTFLLATRGSAPQLLEFNGSIYHLSMLFAPALGGHQIVVADPGAGRDADPEMVPESEFAKHPEVTLKRLPLTMRVRGFWPRCVLYRELPKEAVFPEVTQGAFGGIAIAPRPIVKDMENRNLPAAELELLDNGKSLGTWLVAVSSSARQTVSAGGKTYEVAMRFRRHYTPYSFTLLKFTHDKYRGTEIPKDFRARVRVEHPAKGDAREVDIWMNNPLRYEGLTYFQASFDKDNDQRERKVTILQVVSNPSWLTPYFACVIVGVGLTVQFMIHFVGFIRKRPAAAPKAA